MNEIGNCSALQFVQGKHSQTFFCSLSKPKQIKIFKTGIEIDARGILWVVDSGRVNTLLPGKYFAKVSPSRRVSNLKCRYSQQSTRLQPETDAFRLEEKRHAYSALRFSGRSRRQGDELVSHEGFLEALLLTNLINSLNKLVVDDANGDFAYITDNNGNDPGIVVYSRFVHCSCRQKLNN